MTSTERTQQVIGLRGVHYEIHTIRKPREALPSQVFQVVAKGQRVGKKHILFLDQTTKGILEAQMAQCPPGGGPTGSKGHK